MWSELIVGFLSLLGGGGIVAWVRFRRKDTAEALKINAEATETIVGSFQQLIKSYQDENKLLQLTVNELKMEILKLREQVKQLNDGRALDAK